MLLNFCYINDDAFVISSYFIILLLMRCCLLLVYFHRKEKDPLKPKQPMSAYFLFTNDRRAAILAENKSVLEVIERIHLCSS